jgi:hypothetical protein
MRYPQVTEKPGRREGGGHDPFIDGLAPRQPVDGRTLAPKHPGPRRPRPPRGRRILD